MINNAEGAARAVVAAGEARSKSIDMISKVSYFISSKYYQMYIAFFLKKI